MIDVSEILNGLSDEQKAVCKDDNNILLTACPGSGKTRTLTHRLAYLTAVNPQTHKLNIAITFTNRAANEIKSRLDDMGIESANIWTGTIHQFCMQFIIRPYAMYSDRLSKGYSIIDEYIQKEYVKDIVEQLKIQIGKYDDPLQLPEVVEAYEKLLEINKEIDFDMILSCSHSLLTTNEYICENIASIVNSILVDEFQDTNELQYSILAKLFKTNKSVKLLFVGDVNQAIYGSLGGVAKCKSELDLLFGTSFKEMSLTGCYRSTQRIVNLYKYFEVNQTGVTSVANIKNDKGDISYNKSVTKQDLISEISGIIREQLSSGTPSEDICVLAPQWFILFNLSQKLREQLPDVVFDAPDISPIKYDPLNPLYLIAQLLFMPDGKNVTLKKRIATEIISLMRNDLRITLPEDIQSYDILSTVNHCKKSNEDGIKCFKSTIEQVLSLLHINIQKEKALFDLEQHFFDKTEERIKRYELATDYDSISKYFRDKQGIVISTIHGVKGEEFKTVIAVNLLNGNLPHWDYIIQPDKKLIRKAETMKLLYVLCSRAKKNLYLFSETGYLTQSGNKYTPTDELLTISWNKI